MADKPEFTQDDQKYYRMVLDHARNVSRVREGERHRIADAISDLMYKTKTTEEANMLLALAHIVLDPK